jgi:hypothetical protein
MLVIHNFHHPNKLIKLYIISLLRLNMPLDEKEVEHIKNVLVNTKISLAQNDAVKLKELSNLTLHRASIEQDPGSITIAVVIYTLSKLIERDDYKRTDNWPRFLKKFNAFIDLAIDAIEKQDKEDFNAHLAEARKTLESLSLNMKPYIQEVLRKASINKASKIYEHGLSLEKTAKILGITQWELTDYIGQKASPDLKQNLTLSAKARAKTAMEFFS